MLISGTILPSFLVSSGDLYVTAVFRLHVVQPYFITQRAHHFTTSPLHHFLIQEKAKHLLAYTMAGVNDSKQRPHYGRRLLPCVLDDEAQANPQRVFAALARSNDLSQGFQDVLFQQVANAANFIAYKLHTVFGSKLDHDFETLTYIGLPDLRYSIVFYAAVKCGYKVILNSQLNSSSILIISNRFSYHPLGIQ